jgi:hypothetical protein
MKTWGSRASTVVFQQQLFLHRIALASICMHSLKHQLPFNFIDRKMEFFSEFFPVEGASVARIPVWNLISRPTPVVLIHAWGHNYYTCVTFPESKIKSVTHGCQLSVE